MKYIKLLLSALFLLCLFDMPYGYYQLVRFLAFAGFCFLAYKSNEKNNKSMTFVFIGLAVLFQPFFKIALGRVLWNLIDVVLALILFVSVFSKRNQ
jgi:hypothetical protein